jgi:hypothetical protein
MVTKLVFAFALLCSMSALGQSTVNGGGSPLNGGNSGGAGGSITLENVYTSPGAHTFAHDLNSIFYQVNCVTRTDSAYATATYTTFPVDLNDATVTVPSAGDYICSFSAVNGLGPITGDFSIAAAPPTLLYEPTMSGTQSPTFTITQTAGGGYAGAATYTSSGLASGMTGAFSPSTITGSGTNVFTLSFPYTQTPASTTFTVQGSDGTHTHTATPTITVGNINQGLVECWAGTDGSGATFADDCGTSNIQTLQTGTLTWGTNAGLPGSTATFSPFAFTSGANDTATNFDGTTPFSVSAWIWPTGTVTGSPAIVSTLNPAANFQGWELQLSPTGSSWWVSALIVNTYPVNAIQVVSSSSLTNNALHYVVMTYDGSRTAAGMKIYIDGVASPSYTVDADSLTATAASGINPSIGARTNGSVPFGGGVIAYTRIWNRALSSTDVANYFAAGAR